MTCVDVYPVGWLQRLRLLWHAYTVPGLPPVARQHAWVNIRYGALRTWKLLRAGEWRTVRNSFNGYLAEPTPWPDSLRRCGSGWTKRRALKSLERHGYPPA
jgi:hypothetical protein